MVSRDQGEGGVAVETLVAVVSGALVILSLLLFIIVVLVVRKQNYLAKVSRYFYITREKYLLVQCARSEDYILHSEQPLVAPHIPPPPPLPPSPLYNPEEYKVLDNAGWIHCTLLHPGRCPGPRPPRCPCTSGRCGCWRRCRATRCSADSGDSWPPRGRR